MTIRRDVITSFDFLPRTYHGLEQFIEDTLGWQETEILRGPIEGWAFLYFQLRKAEDCPEWFPSGKWATIQRLEQLLDETVPGRLKEMK